LSETVKQRRDSAPPLIVVFTLVNVLLLSAHSMSQWIAWGGLGLLASLGLSASEIAVGILYAVATNVLCGLLFVWLAHLSRPLRRSWRSRVVSAAAAAAVAAGLRTALLLPVGTAPGFGDGLAGWIASFIGFLTAVFTSLWIGDLLVRARCEHELRAQQETRAARQLAELEREEVLQRRRIADRLHGGVQNGLVVAAAQLDKTAADLEETDHPAADGIREATALLDHIREEQVRSLSHALFPIGAEVGLTRAIGGLLDRMPSSLSGEVAVGGCYRDAVRTDGELVDLPSRIILVDTLEEAITNAVKHGRASTVKISLSLADETDGRVLRLEVSDNGTGLGGSAPCLHGLDRHRARLAARAGSLTLASADTGALLILTLPVSDDSAP